MVLKSLETNKPKIIFKEFCAFIISCTPKFSITQDSDPVQTWVLVDTWKEGQVVWDILGQLQSRGRRNWYPWLPLGRRGMAGGEGDVVLCNFWILAYVNVLPVPKEMEKKLRNKGGVWGCTPLPLWAGKVVITTLVGMIIFLGRLGGRGSCGGLAHTLPILWATWHAPPPKKSLFLISTKGSTAYKFKTQTQLHHCQLCDLGPFSSLWLSFLICKMGTNSGGWEDYRLKHLE